MKRKKTPMQLIQIDHDPHETTKHNQEAMSTTINTIKAANAITNNTTQYKTTQQNTNYKQNHNQEAMSTTIDAINAANAKTNNN